MDDAARENFYLTRLVKNWPHASTLLSMTGRLPSCAESHGRKPVAECELGTLRSLGEGG